MADALSCVENPEREQVVKTIPECLIQYSEIQPGDEALVFVTPKPYQRHSVTWKILNERSLKVARGLRHIGVKRHEIVAVGMENCPEWLYMSFGAIIAGAVPIGISFTYPDGSDVIKLVKCLEKCSLICMEPGIENKNWDIFQTIVDEYTADGFVISEAMPYLRYLIFHDQNRATAGVKCFNDWINGTHPNVEFVEPQLYDVAALFQTSGSTGIPKAVAHTFESIARGCLRSDEFEPPNYFNDMPFGWAGGFPFVLHGLKLVQASRSSGTEAEIPFLIEVLKTKA